MSIIQPRDMPSLRDTMRRTESVKTARAILAHARNRLGDIKAVGWPRLEQSLADELAELEQIARQRGFLA